MLKSIIKKTGTKVGVLGLKGFYQVDSPSWGLRWNNLLHLQVTEERGFEGECVLGKNKVIKKESM